MASVAQSASTNCTKKSTPRRTLRPREARRDGRFRLAIMVFNRSRRDRSSYISVHARDFSRGTRPMMRTYTGSCHCGAVRYEADIDLAQGTSKCNCTFCVKARSWKVFAKPPSFRLLSGSQDIKGYHKHPLAPLKYFCDTCGVRTHEVGS